MVLHVPRITSTSSIDVMQQTLKTELYPKLPVYSVFITPPPRPGDAQKVSVRSVFFS